MKRATTVFRRTIWFVETRIGDTLASPVCSIDEHSLPIPLPVDLVSAVKFMEAQIITHPDSFFRLVKKTEVREIGDWVKHGGKAEKEPIELKCDSCQFQSTYTLGTDECGAGNTEQQCSKGHWFGRGPEVGESATVDYWKDCADCELPTTLKG